MRNTRTHALTVAIALATLGASALAAEPAAAPKCKKGEVLVKTTKAAVAGNVMDAELRDAKKGSVVFAGKVAVDFTPELANRKVGDVFCYKLEDSGD